MILQYLEIEIVFQNNNNIINHYSISIVSDWNVQLFPCRFPRGDLGVAPE